MARVRLLDDTELQEQPRVRLLDERELPGRGEEYGPPQPGVPEQYGPPAQMQQPPSVMADVGKGIGSGIERGVVGAPGMPTDLFRLAQLGWLTLQDKLYGEKGIIYQDPQHRARLEAQVAQQPSFLPGSSEIIEAAKPYVPGLGYEPQTKAGEVAQTFGEFIPGAVIPGQIGLRGVSTAGRVGRAAIDTLYQAAAPAAAAETAEHYAKGTRFEPYAAPAAAIATSLGMGKMPMPNATTAAPGVSAGATSRGAATGSPPRATSRSTRPTSSRSPMGFGPSGGPRTRSPRSTSTAPRAIGGCWTRTSRRASTPSHIPPCWIGCGCG